MLADLSSRFVNLPPAEVDGEIEDALRRLSEPLGIDFAVLWQWSAAAFGVLRGHPRLRLRESLRVSEALKQELFPWVAKEMLGGRNVVIPAVEEMPAEAAVDRENALLLGLKSNLTLPLFVGGELPVGALALNTLRAKRDWSDALVKRLQLIAQVFTNALARKRADQALRESDEVNRATFEQAAAGIAHVGVDGRWLRVNDRLCAIVGYPREELLPLTFQDITHPDDLERDLDRMREVLSGRIKTYEMEKRYIRKDRSLVWINLTVSLVRTASGAPKHFIAVVEDVTERRRAEDALHDLSRRLIQAHEDERALLARELHDDLTQRLAVLAIDVGRAELGAPDGAQTDAMRIVREGLVRLSEDVHSLAYQLHPSVLEELGLEEALRTECDRLGRQSRIELSIKIEPLPEAAGKEAALCLFRVAQEALSNVVRHSRARSAAVALRPLDGGLLLGVRDDGVGFDPKVRGAGRSLGLASMRERVQLVNGTLDVESAPGEGTAVVAWVPLAGEAR